MSYFAISILDMPRQILSNLSVSSLSFAGFVLTLITVLISFKLSQPKYSEEELKALIEEESKNISLFQIFIYSSLYTDVMRILKGALIELIINSILCLIALSFTEHLPPPVQMSLNIFFLSITTLTIFRSVLIISKLVSYQAT